MAGIYEKELEMDTPLDLDQLTHQTKRREFTDGLRDLHVGLTILILSLLNWLILSPTGATWLVKAILYDKTLTVIGLIGFLGLYLFIIFGGERLIEHIRRASLWKDSGFVKPLRWGFNKWITNGPSLTGCCVEIDPSFGMLRDGSAVLRHGALFKNSASLGGWRCWISAGCYNLLIPLLFRASVAVFWIGMGCDPARFRRMGTSSGPVRAQRRRGR
jgi:hypothetical protein